MFEQNFEIVLWIFLGISLLLLLVVLYKNRKTKNNIEKIKKAIKPFEVIIGDDGEKMQATEKLEEGDVINRDVYGPNGKLLYSSGLVVTDVLREELLNNNINFIWIKLSKFKGF